MLAPTGSGRINDSGVEMHEDSHQHKRELDWNPLNNVVAFGSAAWKHWKQRDINWPMCVYMSVVHWVFMVGCKTMVECKWQTLALAFALWIIGKASLRNCRSCS